MYYRWSKAFLDAGKNGLTRDTRRDATSEEVKRLKRALAEACLDVQRYKKSGSVIRRRYVRMGAEQKLEILRTVESSGLPVQQVLERLDISRSTYCGRPGGRLGRIGQCRFFV